MPAASSIQPRNAQLAWPGRGRTRTARNGIAATVPAARQAGPSRAGGGRLVGRTDSYAEVLTPSGRVLDSSSAIGGTDHTWAREFWHAGTFAFIGGAIVSVLAALTGLWDAWKSSEAGTQARRTINTHATIMLTVTVLALIDIAWRLNCYHTKLATPAGIVVLSVIIALLVSLGATFGGSLVYEYGFNVETAGDHPAYHKSEEGVFPGQHDS